MNIIRRAWYRLFGYPFSWAGPWEETDWTPPPAFWVETKETRPADES